MSEIIRFEDLLYVVQQLGGKFGHYSWRGVLRPKVGNSDGVTALVTISEGDPAGTQEYVEWLRRTDIGTRVRMVPLCEHDRSLIDACLRDQETREWLEQKARQGAQLLPWQRIAECDAFAREFGFTDDQILSPSVDTVRACNDKVRLREWAWECGLARLLPQGFIVQSVEEALKVITTAFADADSAWIKVGESFSGGGQAEIHRDCAAAELAAFFAKWMTDGQRVIVEEKLSIRRLLSAQWMMTHKGPVSKRPTFQFMNAQDRKTHEGNLVPSQAADVSAFECWGDCVSRTLPLVRILWEKGFRPKDQHVPFHFGFDLVETNDGRLLTLEANARDCAPGIAETVLRHMGGGVAYMVNIMPETKTVGEAHAALDGLLLQRHSTPQGGATALFNPALLEQGRAGLIAVGRDQPHARQVMEEACRRLGSSINHIDFGNF